MDIAANIKQLRERQGFIQKQVALELGIGYSNYNKMENGAREPSVAELQKLAKLYNITVDELLNPEDITPKEVFIAEKTTNEQMKLIQQLDEEDKQTIFRLIDKMLTNKKFKDFFKNNVATL
jgi:Predicted transcription factor, homolog of eukaryotic MBF1